MASIKILSASADLAFRATLRSAMSGDERVALTDSAWEDAEHLLARIHSTGPNVVLLDETCGPPLGLLMHLRRMFMPARIIVAVDQCGHRRLAELIRYGARGCIQKSAPPDLWRKAVYAVHDGDVWVNRSVVLELLEALAGVEPDHHPVAQSVPDGRLTEREWEVARLVARGMTNKEVARFMTISDTTVKTHLKHIFNKLHVTRRAQIPHPAHPGWVADLPPDDEH